MGKNNKISVLGGGLWGTVLAHVLSRRGDVWLWEFFGEAAEALRRSRKHPHIPGFTLDRNVRVTSDLAEAVEGAEVAVFVLPSNFVRRTARAAARAGLSQKASVINASKGIEPKTLMTMGEVIEAELKGIRNRVYTLTGPSFAKEVAKNVPTSMVLAPHRKAEGLKRLFDGGCLRLTLCEDRKGAELGGSLKNVLAIGCGILDGLGAGANTKAALLIQGMEEMGKLIVRSGGRAETVYGLSGLGDLMATGTSPQSRNRGFGELLGKGHKAAAAVRLIPTVVEGIEASASARSLARRVGLKLPLIESIWSAVHRGAPPQNVLRAMGFCG